MGPEGIGTEWTGADGIGMDGNGREWSGGDGRGLDGRGRDGRGRALERVPDPLPERIKSAKDGSGRDRRGWDGIGQEWIGAERMGQDGSGAERMGWDRTGTDRKGADGMGGNGNQMLISDDRGAVDFHIEGITQMVQHSGRLANPRDPIARDMKAITSKRKKTDEDLDQLADLEWMGGVYTNKNGRVIVPGDVLEGALFEAGKKTRRGADVRSALWVPGAPDLIFPGRERSLEEIRSDPQHFLMSRVGVNSGTVMRARPTFPTWSLKFTVGFLRSVFNARDVHDIVETLGTLVGLSDDRKKQGGRFKILSWNERSLL